MFEFGGLLALDRACPTTRDSADFAANSVRLGHYEPSLRQSSRDKALVRRAVIDIGTNSVKLLVAEVASHAVLPLWEGSHQTRLGEGFYQDHRLRPGAIARTAEAVAQFASKAAQLGASPVRAIGTSAVRDASNQEEFLDQVRSTSGVDVEIISGEQEADWVYAGVRSDPTLAEGTLLILDVGGGSTEIILGQGAQQTYCHSFALGTVRLMERFPHADPPSEQDWTRCRNAIDQFLDKEVKPSLGPHLQSSDRESRLVATGGTAAILASITLGLTHFDRERIERTVLSRQNVQHLQATLWTAPLAKRRQFPGLPPNRADVILFGVAIFEVLMGSLGFEQLRASTRGLRFGAIAAP